ncbi:MAG: hypothetical protein Kow00121_11140 [Elainellaceae cyanobacterium]
MAFEDMNASTPSSSVPLREVIDRIFMTRQITRGDQLRFMAIVLEQEAISGEDRTQIDRLFEALKRGFLKVVD